VRFNPTGLSLIIAEQRSEDSAQTNTYNGVGKSLLIEILHYCLGSKKNAAFEQNLKSWVFRLRIESRGVEYRIARSASDGKDITLDDEPISLTKLRDFLARESFNPWVKTSFLTFRSLISRFVRRGRDAYTEFSYAMEGDSKKPYAAMVNVAYLLGLDLQLAKNKYDLRRRSMQLRETMKQLEKDPLFATLFSQDTLEIELTALREEAVRLEQDIQDFRVADNYYDIEEEANRIKKRLDVHRRSVIKLGNAISQIERSLATKLDIDADKVAGIYREAEVALPDSLRRSIDEVISFHRQLQKTRHFRLSRDKQALMRELNEAKVNVRDLSADLDEKMAYLSDHRALDEYVAINEELSKIRQKIAKLEASQALREQVDKEQKEIERDLAEENIRTDQYLDDVRELVDEATKLFRSFSRELYGSRPSGLSVANDDSASQTRYRIDAHIRADAAEGINEAKIFCFDMVLLTLQRGHRIQFAVHDSTLFQPVDPRQRLAMFRIADRICRQDSFQYVATLNYHDLVSIQEQSDSDESQFGSLFADSVVLRLTDGSPEEKLLGVELDMDYTR